MHPMCKCVIIYNSYFLNVHSVLSIFHVFPPFGWLIQSKPITEQASERGNLIVRLCVLCQRVKWLLRNWLVYKWVYNWDVSDSTTCAFPLFWALYVCGQMVQRAMWYKETPPPVVLQTEYVAQWQNCSKFCH